MLADWLSELGHVVVGIAASSEEAIDLISTAAPDAAIVDFVLADGDAYALGAELKRRRVPFLVMTGTMIEDKEGVFSGVEVLSKPVEFDLLKDSLGRLGVSPVRCDACAAPAL
jgi:CheY-like chemotaxis protein